MFWDERILDAACQAAAVAGSGRRGAINRELQLPFPHLAVCVNSKCWELPATLLKLRTGAFDLYLPEDSAG
jgi:hypothetical protein